MCVRYTLTSARDLLSSTLGVEVPDFYKPRYNASPAQPLPVISDLNPEELTYYYWGTTPDRSKKKSISEKLINISVEKLRNNQSQRKGLLEKRCIIPADGYYTWKQISRKGKVPYRVVLTDQQLFYMAGVWEAFEDEEDKLVRTFKIIVTEPNPMVATFADTMPAILDLDQGKNWLRGQQTLESLVDRLQPFPANQMTTYAVSPRVNDTQYDVPSLLNVETPADQFGNYSLFD